MGSCAAERFGGRGLEGSAMDDHFPKMTVPQLLDNARVYLANVSFHAEAFPKSAEWTASELEEVARMLLHAAARLRCEGLPEA